MKIADYLSAEDVRHFTSKSDLLAWRTVAISWAGIFAVFWLVATWTHPLTLLLALILLPGRQLALAVITHECGHHTLFKTERLNQWVGQWLAANPVFSDMPAYARGHTRHHQLAGTDTDPDLPNYQAYPVSRASFKRKMIRDLTGQTGLKLMSFVVKGAAQLLSSDAEQRSHARPFAQQIAVNAGLAILLGFMFAPWAYLLWIASFMTTYMVIVRVRQVAEHAAVPNLYDRDPRNNTRTTLPSWWERMIFAPNGVNYHLEHHFMASVPCYRLGSLHRLLRQRGAYDGTRVFHGYREVLSHTIA